MHIVAAGMLGFAVTRKADANVMLHEVVSRNKCERMAEQGSVKEQAPAVYPFCRRV